jgi:hypothetical protein
MIAEISASAPLLVQISRDARDADGSSSISASISPAVKHPAYSRLASLESICIPSGLQTVLSGYRGLL